MDTTTSSSRQRVDSATLKKLGQLQKLLLADPDNQRLARECVDLALACGDYDFVLQRTRDVLSDSPQDLTASFDRATALIGKGDYVSAISVLRQITALHPELLAARINLGLCHYLLAQFAEARPPLEAAYRAGERSADLLRLLIQTYHHLGLLNEAITVAKENPQTAAADPALAGAYGLAYLDANQPQSAAKWAMRALAADSNSIDGLTVQATLDVSRMHVAHARERFERVLQLSPENGRAWVGLGTLALLERDLPQARELLRRGVELMPTHVGSWLVLAWVHLFSNELDSAEQVLRTAARLDRNFSEVQGGLAAVAALRGDVPEAQRGIEVALRLDPKCLSAQYARSVLLSRAGDPEGGHELIRKTVSDLSPSEASLLSRILQEVSGQ
jgi:tetratricopeptide (TPR) repeat protein